MSVQQNILPRIASGSNEVFLLSRWGIWAYPPEDIEMLLQAWGEATAAREKLSPMVGCWYNEGGGPNNFVHMWAYSSFEERLRIRQEARDKGVWPPRSDARLNRQENKILLPSSFSPLQ